VAEDLGQVSGVVPLVELVLAALDGLLNAMSTG
jgi:hypothetical protein